MAKRPKENDCVPCHCQQCNGKRIDQANWLLHNGHVQGDVSWLVREIMAMSKRISEEGR